MTDLYISDMSLPRAFICDIDGTLTDHVGIRGHFEYEKVSQDRPIWPVIHIVQNLMTPKWGGAFGKTNLGWVPVFVSGREEFSRDDTLDWLEAFMGLPPVYELFMRPNGDYRKDYIIKKEIFDSRIAPNYWVEFAIDDRNQVVSMWRSIGVPCLQVADGDF